MNRVGRNLRVAAALVVGVAMLQGVCLGADDPPKPGILVKGTAVYLEKGRDNMTMTLTPADEKAKPLTTKTDEKGEFVFKIVPVGKYKLTAKGMSSLRKYRELDPVDIEVTSADAQPITVQVKLTIDR
jgi:hypothetical protein